MNELSVGGWVFLLSAWLGIIGWNVFCFWKVFKHR